MKVTYAHLCDYALISSDGKCSIMGMFSRINVPRLPAVQPTCYLAFELELDYTELGQKLAARIECVDADGTPILRAKVEFEAEGRRKPGELLTAPQVLKLPPLKFVKDGDYDINIFPGNGPVHRVSFEVAAPKQPPPSIDGQPPLELPPPPSK